MATTLTLAQVDALSDEQLTELKTRISVVLEMRDDRIPYGEEELPKLKGLLIVSDRVTKPALGDVWSILRDVFRGRLVMEIADLEEILGDNMKHNTYRVTFHPDRQEMAWHLWEEWRWENYTHTMLNRNGVEYSLREVVVD